MKVQQQRPESPTVTVIWHALAIVSPRIGWIVYPSGVPTPDLSSIQTRHKHCGARLTTEQQTNQCQQSDLLELWLNEQVIWDTLWSTLTECWPTENTWKQQHWSARKVCQSWRLWLQRVLNNATSSYCIKVWCSVSLTTDQASKQWHRQICSILQVSQLTQVNQGVWKVPKRFRRLYETLLPENLEKHCREWPSGKTVRDQASHSRKQQTAIPHSLQRPVRVGLHRQARRDYHPWRQCSLYGLNVQLEYWGGSS